MTKLAIAAATLAYGLLASAALAGPMPGPGSGPEARGLIDQVRYVYRRDCIWVNGGWYYGKPGKYLVCRPYRPPGKDWVWYSEGVRTGWYLPKSKSWHYNKW